MSTSTIVGASVDRKDERMEERPTGLKEKTGRNAAERMKGFLAHYGQTIFNVYLFLWFAGWTGWQTYKTWAEGRLDFVEASFAIQNAILVTLILVRRRHQAIDRSIPHQAVALIAFCSGIFFMGEPATGGVVAHRLSAAVIVLANVLGIVTLLNLGRSFGILIARREIKSGGLYRFVRHPMYGTDILLRIGFLISHAHWKIAALFVLSTACYVWRAMLEERFLGEGVSGEDYREYQRRVRYRFIPGIF